MSARLLVALTLLVLPASGLAQQSGSVGSPIPGSLSSGERSEVRPVDPEEVGKPWDPTLSEIDRVDASIRLRAITGKDKEDCHYGPVERRIPEERLSRLFGEIRDLSPVERFQAVLNEPEDSSVEPRSILILAPYVSPQPPGLSCPKGDVTAQLLEERERLVREGAVPTTPPTAGRIPRVGSAKLSAYPYPTPVIVKFYGPKISELQRVEAIIKNRASKGLDQLPDCVYGPVQLRVPLDRVTEYVEANPDLSGEDYWHWLTSQPEDPKAFPLTVMVRSGVLPSCPAGNIDDRLRNRRDALRRERSQ